MFSLVCRFPEMYDGFEFLQIEDSVFRFKIGPNSTVTVDELTKSKPAKGGKGKQAAGQQKIPAQAPILATAASSSLGSPQRGARPPLLQTPVGFPNPRQHPAGAPTAGSAQAAYVFAPPGGPQQQLSPKAARKVSPAGSRVQGKPGQFGHVQAAYSSYQAQQAQAPLASHGSPKSKQKPFRVQPQAAGLPPAAACPPAYASFSASPARRADNYLSPHAATFQPPLPASPARQTDDSLARRAMAGGVVPSPRLSTSSAGSISAIVSFPVGEHHTLRIYPSSSSSRRAYFKIFSLHALTCLSFKLLHYLPSLIS